MLFYNKFILYVQYIYKMEVPNVVGLPKTVDYSLPPSLSASSNSRFVSIAPNGITQTSTVSLPTTSFVVNSGGPVIPFIQQLFAFDIPCGSSVSTFLDTTQTTINFRLAWTITTAGNIVGANMNIISSLASFISSLTLYSNNSPLETINNYDLLHNLLLNSTLNVAQRQANAFQFGADSNTFTGIDLPITATGTYYFNVSLPLLSLIGVNGNQKMFPIGLLQNLQLQLLTNQWAPISTFCTGTITAQPVGSFFLDSFALSLKYVDLGMETAGLLAQNIQGGKLYLKASTYVNANTTIQPAGGSQTLILQIRNSSVKSIFATIGSQGIPLTCPNFLYDSINPALTSVQLSIPSLGYRLPNKPLNPSQRPAESQNHYMMAWGSGPASSYGGICNSEVFHMHYGALQPGTDARFVVPGAGVRTTYTGDDNATYGNIQKFPNMFYLGFDLEKTQSALFQGVSTRSCPPQIDLTLAIAPAVTLQFCAFALVDVVVVFDVETKGVQVFN